MSVKTALVVEDDKGIQSLLRDALEPAGFQVSIEKDAEAGLSSLGRRFPDLLITDLLLPGIGGFEMLERLRAMPGGNEVPVVIVSGIYRGAKHRKQARERFDIVSYFDKPFDIAAVVQEARRLVGRSGRAAPPRRASRAAPDGNDVQDDPLADFDQRLERDEVEKSGAAFEALRAGHGNLKNKRFPELLAQLFRVRATGALLLRRGRIKKIVYLKDGFPIFVKSNLLSECLGRVLVREKLIREEECEQSIERLKSQPGKQQGTLLIEMGALSPHNLVAGLQLQLETKLFDVFGWPDGDYQFSDQVDVPATSVHLDMSMPTLAYEGVRRKYTEQQLDDLLHPFVDLFIAPHPDPLLRLQDIALEADERELVGLVDGRRTLREVIARAGVPQRQAMQLLYALMATELIQPAARATKKRDGADAAPPLPPRASTKPEPARPPPLPRGAASMKPEVAASISPYADLSVEQLRQRLVERVRRMRRQNAFEVLGVARRATTDEVQRAHGALVREMQPERWRRFAEGSVPADIRALSEQVQHQILVAYEAIADERRRADLAARLDQPQRTPAGDDVVRLLAADTRARRGEGALLAGRIADAAQCFADAIVHASDDGELHAQLGWCVYLQRPDDVASQLDAIAKLQKGVELAPRFDRGWLWLGRVVARAGRPNDAVRHFERALQCNPDNVEAADELKLRSAVRR